MHAAANQPAYQGLESYQGTVLHAADYRDAEVFRGRRVLIVGGGNSGCDLAVEAGWAAEVTLHSTRHGYRVLPKHVLGRPLDQVDDLLSWLRVPDRVRRSLGAAAARMAMPDPRRFGVAADRSAEPAVVNPLLPHALAHGMVRAKPDVARFRRDGVVFADGSSAPVDIVVFATGYDATYPFVDAALLPSHDGRVRLARQMFSPADRRIAVVGHIAPDSGQWTLAHWQAMVLATYALALRTDGDLVEQYREMLADADDASGPRIRHQRYLRTLEQDLHRLEAARC